MLDLLFTTDEGHIARAEHIARDGWLGRVLPGSVPRELLKVTLDPAGYRFELGPQRRSIMRALRARGFHVTTYRALDGCALVEGFRC